MYNILLKMNIMMMKMHVPIIEFLFMSFYGVLGLYFLGV